MSSHLKPLLVKEFLISKRNKKQIVCELLVPLFIIPFIIGVAFTLDSLKSPSRGVYDNFNPIQPFRGRLRVGNIRSKDYTAFENLAFGAGGVEVVDIGRNGQFDVVFRKFDIANKQFEYYITTNDVTGQWLNNEPYIGPGLADAELGRIKESENNIVMMQNFVDTILLKLCGISNNIMPLAGYFPLKKYDTTVITITFSYIHIILVVATLIPMAMLIKDVVNEIETEMKTYLLVMGMSRISYYFTVFIVGSIKMLIVMVLVAGSFFFVLKFKVSFFIFVLSFFFALYSVAFALLCATLIQRIGLSVTVNMIGSIGLIGLAKVTAINRLRVARMCFFALNPVAALSMGIADLEASERFGAPVSVFSSFRFRFNLLHALIFLIVDTLFIMGLTIVMDFVIPSVDSASIDFSALWDRCRKKEHTEKQISVKLDETDFEPVNRTDEPGVDVLGLRKRWNNSPNYAVYRVTFQAYPGDITALLGHNGAGKSTTFSCLTGYTKPTAGEVKVTYVAVEEDLSAAREYIGYCPQGNPLFDKLTCIEHLRLAAHLRDSFAGDDDCLEILEEVGLKDAVEVLAKDLSGGMKRKLCVAMALVGRSKVVLLDEPTAGMDPTARRQIGDILDQFKDDRTIILTTHYMDEADLLSDRIMIMVKGKIICSGSSSFLKNRFGTGFLLVITLNSTAKPPNEFCKKILSLVKKNAEGSKMLGSPASQFTINLPYDSKKHFVKLFRQLEMNKQNLQIDSFGLSVNTLEQVFIKVGEKAEKESGHKVSGKIVSNAKKIEKQDHERNPNFLTQFFALTNRNMIYFCRFRTRYILPFLMCILIHVCLFIGNLDEDSDDHDASHHRADQTMFTRRLPKSTVVSNSADHIKQKYCSYCSFKTMSFDIDGLRKSWFDFPPYSIGYFHNPGNSTAYLVSNAYLSGGKVMALNVFHNLLFNNDILTNIKVGVQKGRITAEELSLDIEAIFTSVLATFVLTFGITMLLNTVITERVVKFKHQLHLASATRFLYWLVQFTTDLSYFAPLATLSTGLMIYALKLNFACSLGLVPILILYFTGSSLANYVLSYAFGSPTKRLVFVMSFHSVVPLFVMITYMSVSSIIAIIFGFKDVKEAGGIMILMRGIFPSLNLAISQSSTAIICTRNSSITSIYNEKFFQLEPKNENLLALLGLGINVLLYGVLLVVIEKGWIRKFFEQRHAKKFEDSLIPAVDEDVDVDEERKRIETLSDGDQALCIRNLYKFYSKNKCAVQDLSFAIGSNECFGLLGVNGAGKTTTFDMITNMTVSTSGSATIFGEDVEDTPQIGYCPQFDALSTSLTGRETLSLLGRLNGFAGVDERVDMVLECVLLTSKANDLVSTYSGGQKRRLSIAVCLMSGSKFLVLDEPTAGVDPSTRRHIWDLLTAMRHQNKAILLTTHSMEECEALCTRIGFLKGGRLCGVGTSQHLKSRYGNTYALTFIIAEASKETMDFVDNQVCVRFKVVAKDISEKHSALSWTLPKKKKVLWSQTYEKFEKFVKELNDMYGSEVVKEFYLVQDSLEQVFTRLANREEDPEKRLQRKLRKQEKKKEKREKKMAKKKAKEEKDSDIVETDTTQGGGTTHATTNAIDTTYTGNTATATRDIP
ncbi:unnamed protein product [Bursaphelenchus okinawaensis]|uniref:ABC transporter domain-containing protein n=1 Tax=Bursaphelenchus okinawaensis TaxID=465554 RepID=A0A811KLK5_9BILA|nr:unnamed protein product [Bursaphelenchus okinawaensis]CAG9106310.1 unnamed protein product [Bursaphelenchus okinawaensis]